MHNVAVAYLNAMHNALQAEWNIAFQKSTQPVPLYAAGLNVSISSSLTITGSDRNPNVTVDTDGNVEVTAGGLPVTFSSDAAADGLVEDLSANVQAGIGFSGLSYTATSPDTAVGVDHATASITASLSPGPDQDGGGGSDYSPN